MTARNPLFELFIWSLELAKTLDQETITDLVVHFPRYYGQWWKNLLIESPLHLVIETTLILFIIWLMFIRKTVDPNKLSKNSHLSSKEIDWLLDTWEPEPLVRKLSAKELSLIDNMMVVEEVKGDNIKIRGIETEVLNATSLDFLGLSQHPEVKKAAKDTLQVYGCGSCGPRGFYGTIDKHLLFEKAIAKFMGTDDAITYSDSASAVSSAIPAFSKRGDLIVVDDACNESIMTGCNLSRSTVQFFKHNDMADLRTVLETIAENDRKHKRDATQQRRFIIVEGLYANVGDICNLPELLQLKEEFFYRVILDESLSFGTLGTTGKGVTEYFGRNVSDVEIILVAMDTVLGSVGGVCVGSKEIVDHQRLSGAGYCFSASAPPFLSSVAITSLEIIQRNPRALLDRLDNNSRVLYEGIKAIAGLKIRSNIPTPVLHISLSSKDIPNAEVEYRILEKIAKDCTHNGVGVTLSKHNMMKPIAPLPTVLGPSIVVVVRATYSTQQMQMIIQTLSSSVLKYTS